MFHLQSTRRFAAGVLFAILCIAVSACSHNGATTTRTDFVHGNNKLAARLMLPGTPGPHPAVLIVHGDGEGTWDSYGYYKPYIRALNNAGFAVYSWNKPGISGSTGNWLDQSMQDRADEVIAAASALRARPDIRPNEIGLLGFSQAGWVMPKAIRKDPSLAFMVSVSGAVNWLDQSSYITRNRMRLEGASAPEIETAIGFDQKLIDLLVADADYAAYKSFMQSAPECCDDLMSEERWTFVKLNFRSDVREDLAHVKVPVLAVFGDKDMNVDYVESAEVYRNILGATPGADTIITLEDADHSLLPAMSDRYATAGPDLTQRIISVEIFGADAFAGDAIELIAEWVSELDHLSPRTTSAEDEW